MAVIAVHKRQHQHQHQHQKSITQNAMTTKTNTKTNTKKTKTKTKTKATTFNWMFQTCKPWIRMNCELDNHGPRNIYMKLLSHINKHRHKYLKN